MLRVDVLGSLDFVSLIRTLWSTIHGGFCFLKSPWVVFHCCLSVPVFFCVCVCICVYLFSLCVWPLSCSKVSVMSSPVALWILDVHQVRSCCYREKLSTLEVVFILYFLGWPLPPETFSQAWLYIRVEMLTRDAKLVSAHLILFWVKFLFW